MGKKTTKKNSFINYLERTSYLGEYSISNLLKFHWANWNKSCEFQSELVESGIGNSDPRNKAFNEKITNLKNHLVWIRRGQEFPHQISIYDLYSLYLNKELQAVSPELFSETIVALDNEAGPYFALSSMRWFNKDLCRLVTYDKLLKRETDFRTFRVNVKLPCFCTLNNTIFREIPTKIEQLGEYGILIHVKGRHHLHKFKNTESLTFNLNFDGLKEESEDKFIKSVESFKNEIQKNDGAFSVKVESILAYNNFEFSGGANTADEFYIFIKYEDLDISDKPFTELVTHSKNYLMRQFRKKAA